MTTSKAKVCAKENATHSLIIGLFPTGFIKLKPGHHNNPSDSGWEQGLQSQTDLSLKLGFRTTTMSLGKFLNLSVPRFSHL